MADYATLIWELKEELRDGDTPVIGFGGWAGSGGPGPLSLLWPRGFTARARADAL